MESSQQYTRAQTRFTTHLHDSDGPLNGPLVHQSTNPGYSIRVGPGQYPTTTLRLQAPHTSHRKHGPMTDQASPVPPPHLGPITQGPFPGYAYVQSMTAPQNSTSSTLGFPLIQGHSIAHNTYGQYPYPPLSSSQFDPLSPPPQGRQGQPTIGNPEYYEMNLDWLSSLVETPHHQYTSTNPSILVSPASGNHSTFTGHTDISDTCVTGSHPNIGPVYVPGASASPFNSLGAGLTPLFSSTPSTFDLSASPGLTQHSPAVPYPVRPLAEESEGEQGLDLVALFSRPPSAPYGNLAIEPPYSKGMPSAPPPGGNLLAAPLSIEPAFTDPNALGVHNAVLSRSSDRAPYAMGRKEVRFPNQKKVNVVDDMCKRFPEESDIGKLLKRICATVWYHNGELEPTFGNGSEELTGRLALGFEAGQSILLGFIGKEGVCLYCGHTSPKRDRIIAHVREHLGLRPFVCMEEKCPCKELSIRPAFSSREALTSHLRNPIRNITCNFCRKPIKSNNVRRHLNARHRDQVQLPEQQRMAKHRSKSLPA